MAEPSIDSMLIAYDGSEEAKIALAYAGKVLRVKRAYILTAWEPLHRQAARAASHAGMMQSDVHATEENGDPAHDEAVVICREGVEGAAAEGFEAKPYLVETETTIWSAIIDAANELDASVIVTGNRGLSGVRSLFSTSTSDALAKNAGRPVLIVPAEQD